LGEGVRLLIPDMRGRGLSDKPANGYALDDHAQDMLGLMDALGVAKVALVGHSFGGLLSWYISRYYPERVSKVVILDSALEVAHERVLSKIRPSLERLGKAMPSYATFTDAMKVSPYYNDGSWDEDVDAMYRYDMEDLPDGTARSRVHKAGIEELIDHILTHDWADIIRHVAHPTLLVHAAGGLDMGRAEAVVTAQGAQETLALLQDGRLHTVTGNHMTMLFGEQARALAGVIRAFLLP
jgi:pimeloyl-ACP methyl ester carboxylesterase